MLRKLFRRKSTKPLSAIDQLPMEVKREIASFLPVPDLVILSEILGVVVKSSPLTDRASQNRVFETKDTTQCFAAVIPNQTQTHSHPTIFAFDVVADRLQFKDGIIWVVEQDLPASQSPDTLESLPFKSGKSVAKVMATNSGKENLSFFPQAGKFYQFWVNNSSQLQVNNMKLHQVSQVTMPSRHAAFQFEASPPEDPTTSFAVRRVRRL